MTTRLIQKIYQICDGSNKPNDNSLIPGEASTAIVDYDENGPRSVYFVPRDTANLRTMKDVRSASNKYDQLNPLRTREDVKKIAKTLEKSLERRKKRFWFFKKI